MASNELTRKSLQLLVGPEIEVRPCDLACGLKHEHRYEATKEYGAIVIFACRDKVDPIATERLRNQGHRIQFVELPRRDCGELSTCIRLRSLCEQLVKCFPEREQEFRLRLADVERELRMRARIRAIRPAISFA